MARIRDNFDRLSGLRFGCRPALGPVLSQQTKPSTGRNVFHGAPEFSDALNGHRNTFDCRSASIHLATPLPPPPFSRANQASDGRGVFRSPGAVLCCVVALDFFQFSRQPDHRWPTRAGPYPLGRTRGRGGAGGMGLDPVPLPAIDHRGRCAGQLGAFWAARRLPVRSHRSPPRVAEHSGFTFMMLAARRAAPACLAGFALAGRSSTRPRPAYDYPEQR